MTVEERRKQLLRAGIELLRHRGHEKVSIGEIAEAAGVSKGLLYHYFPSKTDFLVAALEQGQAELAESLQTDPDLDPVARLDAGIAAFLDSVEENSLAYRAIFKRGGTDPDIAAILEAGRERQLQALIDAIAGLPDPPAALADRSALEAALQGWLFFCEGAVLRWLEHPGLTRDQLERLLRKALIAAISPTAKSPASV